MPKIFISYRRADSGYPAQAIYDKFKDRYGAESLLFDVDSIPLGVDFHAYLDEQVSRCDVLLAIIGERWLNARSDDGGRRLDDPDDFVRIEIGSALKRGIPVIPVLIDNASVPKAGDLPAELKPLVRRNGAEVRPGRDYQDHLERLVHGVDRLFSQELVGRPREAVAPRSPAGADDQASRPQRPHDPRHVLRTQALPAGDLRSRERPGPWMTSHLEQAAEAVFLDGEEMHTGHG